MTRDQLLEMGRAVYGERWQTPLARALGIGSRTVRRWLAADWAMASSRDNPLPKPEHWARIEAMFIERRVEQSLAAIAELMAAQGAPPADIAFNMPHDRLAAEITRRVVEALTRQGIEASIH